MRCRYLWMGMWMRVTLGSESKRPKGIAGELYCNTTTRCVEVHTGKEWVKLEPYRKVSLSQQQYDELTNK